MPLDRLDPPKLRKFIADLSSKGLAPASVRRAYAPLRAMLGSAYDDGLIKTNPAAGVRVVVKETRTRSPKWLTADQTKALLAEMPSDHADLAYVLASTGLRISEALAIRWRDIESAADGIILKISEAKTDAGVRMIPLSPEAVRRLIVRRSQSPYPADGDPVFPSRAGTPLNAHNWRQRIFNPAAERAGVPWCTPHKLRHGMASLMAECGYSPAAIASHLGHADGGALALKVYIHADRLGSAKFADDAFGSLGEDKSTPPVDQNVDLTVSARSNP